MKQPQSAPTWSMNPFNPLDTALAKLAARRTCPALTRLPSFPSPWYHTLALQHYNLVEWASFRDESTRLWTTLLNTERCHLQLFTRLYQLLLPDATTHNFADTEDCIAHDCNASTGQGAAVEASLMTGVTNRNLASEKGSPEVAECCVPLVSKEITRICSCSSET